MFELIKILIVIVLLIAFFLPIILVSVKRIGAYKMPKTKKNIIFLLFSLLEMILFIILAGVFASIADFIVGIPWIGNIISNTVNNLNPKFDFISFTIIALVINFIILYGYIFFKAFFVRRFVKKDSDKEEAIEEPQEAENPEEHPEQNEEPTEPTDEDPKGKKIKVPEFLHYKSTIKKTIVDEFGEEEEIEIETPSGFAGLFFEKPDFIYAKPWVYRCIKDLQIFIYLMEVLYFLIFTLLIVTLFYPVSDGMYKFLIDILQINKWYIYPYLSLIFLQELCNIFNTYLPLRVDKKEKNKKKDSEEELLIRVKELQRKINERFDEEHHLRFFPAQIKLEIPEYKITNVAFKPALEFIKSRMLSISGHVVQSYMESLDAMYNGNHVYFCASFYSEFGEYLISYAYTKLLAGERLIFVVSNPENREDVKKYIKKRLNNLTHTTQDCTWRVYTSDERVDQADILIACPNDFADDAIAVNYPVFFEEVHNAIFIDVDKIIMYDSYISPIMAMRLFKATKNRVKFIFLTDNVYRGLSAGSLPKFFCIDKVSNYSGAKENENVTYNLWNRESKNNRIYNKYNQILTNPECLVSELAVEYDIDGIRLITDAPIEHGDMQSLVEHKVEVNSFYKDIPNINYMIYTDNRCNLSAAIYLCTRFRGKKDSVIHIMSKPYLLREYFMSKMDYEDFINRSSFIQPRVTEHVNNQKLSLLRIYCEATVDNGMALDSFSYKMRNIISLARKRGDNFLSPFCKSIIFDEENDIDRALDKIAIKDLAAYLISGLCDEIDTPVLNSIGNKAIDYFLIVDTTKTDGYNMVKTKNIVFNRTKEIFEKVLKDNERVTLILNDQIIGLLDTFPSRVKSEYVTGQSLVYNNVEYEIEQITSDYKTIFLKRENVHYKNVFDTIYLRRYDIQKIGKRIGEPGIMYHSKSKLARIIVELFNADVRGETYGFYNLMSDNQSLDFIKGAKGNPALEDYIVEANARNIKNGKILKLTLESRDMECNDGMRLLLSAIFNEFIKTIFPDAYKCIAVVPVLQNRFTFDKDILPSDYEDHVKRLYPYLTSDISETNDFQMQFYFINDCENEDVGVLNWLHDSLATFMQELLLNVYSYCSWLLLRPNEKHYIYFGNDSLAKCFDLPELCKLLSDLRAILSDSGIIDYDTAFDIEDKESLLRCSFCHHILESGRYSIFNGTRYICNNCYDVVNSQEKLDDLYREVYKYLTEKFPNIKFPEIKVVLGKPYNLQRGEELSEYYSKFDYSEKTLEVELDLPVNNAKVAIIRGLIEMWQHTNDLVIPEAKAQLYFEELKYLMEQGDKEAVSWILEHLDEQTKKYVLEIFEFIGEVVPQYEEVNDQPTDNEPTEQEDEPVEADEEPTEQEDEPVEADEEPTEQEDEPVEEEEEFEEDKPSGNNSFEYIMYKASLIDGDGDDDDDGLIDFGDEQTDLYDPNKIPRFWKRYLRNQVSDEEIEEDNVSKFKDNVNVIRITPDMCCLPFNPDEEDPIESEEEPVDPVDEPIESEEEPVDPVDEPIESEEEPVDPEEDDPKRKKKKGLFGFLKKKKKKNKKKDEPIESEEEPVDPVDDPVESEEEPVDPVESEEEPKGKTKKAKGKKVKDLGIKMVPYEDDERTNPRIKLYNEIARHAYNFDTSYFPIGNVPSQEIVNIWRFVLNDYPELFWLQGCSWNSSSMKLTYRCVKPDGEVDKKQVNVKRRKLRDAAEEFKKGITKKTDPYEAFLTIYRRLILKVEYDYAGLNAPAADESRDDNLRSLYSALVEHKIVCAGYAVALQYLLHSVGIPCAYVSSEVNPTDKDSHAFNIVKIGKSCYYVDATWSDSDRDKNAVGYDYCCVPIKEFLLTSNNYEWYHMPRKEFYPFNVGYKATKYEYHHYHDTFMTRCNEQQIVNGFVNAALKYDKNEKVIGDLVVSFKCANAELTNTVYNYIRNNYNGIISEVKSKLKQAKKEKLGKLFDSLNNYGEISTSTNVTINYTFYTSKKKKK